MKTSKKDLSPIIVFAYNRKNHLKKTINSLKKCNLSKNSKLIIYLDNYKNHNEKKKSNKSKKILP